MFLNLVVNLVVLGFAARKKLNLYNLFKSKSFPSSFCFVLFSVFLQESLEVHGTSVLFVWEKMLT